MRLMFFFLVSFGLLQVSLAHGQKIEFTPEENEWIKTHPIVEFGYEAKWEPYEIYQNDEYTGIVGEYVKILEKKTGIDFRPIPDITWKESYTKLRNGKIQMVPSCAISDVRKKELLFTEPFIVDPFVIATKNEYEFVGNLNDLIGKKITLPESYYAIDLIKEKYPGIEIIEKKTVRECLDLVSFGQADAYIGSLGVISYYINHKGFTNLKISAPTNFEDIEIAMAFPKDQKILHGICQKVIRSISIQKRSRIRKDWISVRYEYSFNWTKVLSAIITIVLIMIICFLIFFLWNRSLKKEIKQRRQLENELQHSLRKIQKQDKEKSVLLQEIHHRVKNNLQIISSMMRLQANVSENEDVKDSLSEATDRIAAIALVHHKIYNSDEFGGVSLKTYLESLSSEILKSFGASHVVVSVSVEGEFLGLRSIVPIALIVNELMTNSIKHAFIDRAAGEIVIEVSHNSSQIKLKYCDNGVWTENTESTGFGTSLVDVFTEQLEGNYDLIKKQTGTEYRFNLLALDWEN